MYSETNASFVKVESAVVCVYGIIDIITYI